jgi:hypothetical protein
MFVYMQRLVCRLVWKSSSSSVFCDVLKPHSVHAIRQICRPHVTFCLIRLAWSCKTEDNTLRVDQPLVRSLFRSSSTRGTMTEELHRAELAVYLPCPADPSHDEVEEPGDHPGQDPDGHTPRQQGRDRRHLTLSYHSMLSWDVRWAAHCPKILIELGKTRGEIR